MAYDGAAWWVQGLSRSSYVCEDDDVTEDDECISAFSRFAPPLTQPIRPCGTYDTH